MAPAIPSKYLTIEGEKIKLTPELYEKYKDMVGEYRLKQVKKSWTGQGLRTHNLNTLPKSLQVLYNKSRAYAKAKFIEENEKELKALMDNE